MRRHDVMCRSFGTACDFAAASFLLFIAFFGVCAAPTKAAAEFCPARVTGIHGSSGAVQAITYRYGLQALTDRVVEGTIVADTDHGWYSWKQAPAQLVLTRYASWSPTNGGLPLVEMSYTIAQSGEQSVTFPVALQVYRAWVATAQTHGEMALRWDQSGLVDCEPTDFPLKNTKDLRRVERTPNTGDPTPPPPAPAAVAMATAPPFAVTTCDHPFVTAVVTHPFQPSFPESLRSSGFTQRATSEIEVAVGPDGNLVDAWVFASSGYPQLDESALIAAKRSTYKPAISYCKAVGASYLFRADFSPR